MAEFNYSIYAKGLQECNKSFGGVFSLPIIDDCYKEIINNYKDGNVLDIGAGANKPLENMLKGAIKNGEYYSMDNDHGGSFDFNSFKDIPIGLKFNLIVANQFFEHLTINESIETINNIYNLLSENGVLIATIPNVSHPNRYWADITHKVHWQYSSLYMLFTEYGKLEVSEIFRCSKRRPKGILEKLIANYVSRIYRMDWCDSIQLIAGK